MKVPGLHGQHRVQSTHNRAGRAVLLGSRRCSLSLIPGDLCALWVDGRSGRASWARLDAIHHPDDHHDQSDDPENEPDRSTHFYLLFPMSDAPSCRCGARLRLVVSYQPVLPYEPTRERRSPVGGFEYPCDPSRGCARLGRGKTRREPSSRCLPWSEGRNQRTPR